MKKLIPLLMLVVFVVASCAPHIHMVGARSTRDADGDQAAVVHPQFGTD